MDKAGVRTRLSTGFRIANIEACFFVFVIGAILTCACSAPPVAKKTVPTPAPTPLQPDAVKVEKPINVSFSTYSTDWPVGWTWIDPAEKYDATTHDVKTGSLRVRITSKKNLNADDHTAPRYVKAITGDFQIETRLKFQPTEDYQGAGLLIYENDLNYILLQRAYGGAGGGGGGIRLDVQNPEGFAPVTTPKNIQTDVSEVELKIIRSGGVFSAFWREDENAAWHEAGSVTADYPATVLVGLVACNTTREMAVNFRYIHLLPPEK